MTGPARPPNPDEAYKGYVMASLALAIFVGFLLGLHVPVSRLMDAGRPERTLDLIRAHGQVQLLGFAGLYVMGMSLRLMPRFSGGGVAFPSLIPAVLWLVVLSLVLRAVVMPWFYGDMHDALYLAGSFGLAIAGACFLLICFGTLTVNAPRNDPSALPFLLGATLLFLALAGSAWAGLDAVGEGSRGLPYLADNAVLQLELAGFVMSFVLGVSTRALPAMAGIERPMASVKLTAVWLAAAVLLLAGSMAYLEYVAYVELPRYVASLAFALLGLVFLQIVWLTGILRPAANRIRPASRPHLWLLRGAFAWLTVAGVISVYSGVTALWDGSLPAQLEFDAVRHALAVGVVTQLIAGMSLMIVPEFAAERLQANRQRTRAFVLFALLNVAAVLRVLPALAGDSWSLDLRNALMAAAGTCAEVAMLYFAFTLIRQFRRGELSLPFVG